MNTHLLQIDQHNSSYNADELDIKSSYKTIQLKTLPIIPLTQNQLEINGPSILFTKLSSVDFETSKKENKISKNLHNEKYTKRICKKIRKLRTLSQQSSDTENYSEQQLDFDCWEEEDVFHSKIENRILTKRLKVINNMLMEISSIIIQTAQAVKIMQYKF